MMKKIILFTLLIFCTVFYESFGQNVDAESITLNRVTTGNTYALIKANGGNVGGILLPNIPNGFGDQNDLTFYSSGQRDLNFRAANGNINFFPDEAKSTFRFFSSGTYRAYRNGDTTKGIQLAHGGTHAYVTNIGTVGNLDLRWRNNNRITLAETEVQVHKPLKFGNSYLNDDQGGSIELRGVSSSDKPFIDFHYGGAVSDYNTRIINNSDKRLTVQTPGGSTDVTLNVLGNVISRSSDIKASGSNDAFLTTENANGSLLLGTKSDGVGVVLHGDWDGDYDMSFYEDRISVKGVSLSHGNVWGGIGAQISNAKVGPGWAMKIHDDGNVDVQAQTSMGGKIEIRADNPHVVLGRTDNSDDSQTIIIGSLVINDSGNSAPDYVFSKEYRSKLPSLSEVNSFVNVNSHLPDFPKGDDYEVEYDVKKMNFKMIEKIEQLFLYIIEQDKRIVELEKRNN